MLAFAFLFANMRIALRGVVPDPLIVPLRGSQPSININRILRLLTYPVALVFALMIGTASSGAWLTVLRYLERSAFGTVDPVFGRDIGHYVFSVPAFATGISLLTTLAIVALVLTVPVYLLRRDVILLRRRVTVEPSAQWHLAGLVAFLLLTLALRVFIVEVPSIMYATTGPSSVQATAISPSSCPLCARPGSQPSSAWVWCCGEGGSGGSSGMR